MHTMCRRTMVMLGLGHPERFLLADTPKGYVMCRT